MKNYLKILLIIFCLSTLCGNCAQVQNSNKSEYLQDIHKWRALLYNGLNLCPEQVEKFEEIYKDSSDKDLRKNDRELKKILTGTQKAKYSMIRKLQKSDFKKKEKDYYKANPCLPKFGNPEPVTADNSDENKTNK